MKIRNLKNVWVIFILSFDPFKRNRMVYTIQNRCVELPEMEYDDGATTLFLYSKGTEGEPSEAMKTLLNYFQKTTRENAVTPELTRIQEIVEEKILDPEIKERYMDWEEYIERERDEVRDEAEKIIKKEKKRAEKAEQRAAEAEKILIETKEELIRLRELISQQ